MKRALVLLLLFAVLVAAMLRSKSDRVSERDAVEPPSPAQPSPPQEPDRKFATQPDPAPTPHPRRAGSPLATELNAPNSDGTRDVAVLHEMLRQYQRHMHRREGLPIGNDTDLARVLAGHNPIRLVVLPPDHPALSPDGRLRDRWGTPYFIHARGNGAFEIRSAGPDRRLFTPDDCVENAGVERATAPSD